MRNKLMAGAWRFMLGVPPFLWEKRTSEEHAREYRRKRHRVRGAYFTAQQAAYLNRAIQSALFGW